MKFNKNFFYVFTFILFLLFTGVYACQKDQTGNAPKENLPDELQTDVQIADLLASMNMYHFKSPREAPDFELTSLKGKKISLAQYRGKVVLLSFGATW